MPTNLELSVVLTTYQRPEHLERSLASLAHQQSMKGRFEVIVADDGSADRTHSIVREFSRSASFPVKLATHPHGGFRVALCRNDGVRASTAPYLLFSDSDCIFPADHLHQHLRRANQESFAPAIVFGWIRKPPIGWTSPQYHRGNIPTGFRPKSDNESVGGELRISVTDLWAIPRNPSSLVATSPSRESIWKRSTASMKTSSAGDAKTMTWRFACERPACESAPCSVTPVPTICGMRPTLRGQPIGLMARTSGACGIRTGPFVVRPA